MTLHALTRRALPLAAATLLAGCATAAKPIVMDRQALTTIKTVALPPIGWPDSPTVHVVNSTAGALAQFGLIGIVAMTSDAIVRSNRRDAVRTILAREAFDPKAYFQARLATVLQERGLTPAATPATATPDRTVYLATPLPFADQDALLDCYVGLFGFVANSDADEDPFRPTIVVNARLAAARDGAILMRDAVVISAGPTLRRIPPPAPADFAPSAAAFPAAAPPPPQGTDPAASDPLIFTTFGAIEAEPKRAVAALRHVLDQAALGIGKRLG